MVHTASATKPHHSLPSHLRSARTVLVTGGTRGIGAEVVRALSNRGVVTGCTYHSSRDSAVKLTSELPSPSVPIAYELGSQTSADRAVDDLIAHTGALDGLILNAGTWAGGRLDRMDPDQWSHIAHQAIDGAAQLCRAAMPHLARSDQPSITLVSSVVGLIGHPGDTAYASAKAGLIGFGRSLAKEAARDSIRVNIVAPGFVETNMTREVDSKARSRIEEATFLGRLGTPEEIASAIVFLSEDATFCTGSVLAVDGGWSI